MPTAMSETERISQTKSPGSSFACSAAAVTVMSLGPSPVGIRDHGDRDPFQRIRGRGREPFGPQPGADRRVAQPLDGRLDPPVLDPGRQRHHAQDRAPGQVGIRVVGQVEPQRTALVDQGEQEVGRAVVVRDMGRDAGRPGDLVDLAHADVGASGRSPACG